MIVIDAHLDIAWSALGWNRDLTLSVPAIRSKECGMTGKNRGTNTVSFPEMKKGEVAVALATILARAGDLRDCRLDFRTQEMAYAIGQGQLAYYRIMEDHGRLRMLKDGKSLESHMEAWQRDASKDTPLGFILSMEGADPIVFPSQVEAWWKDGLRVVGPVHYGKNAYAHGTGSPGGLTPSGRDLLKAMENVRMILDVTHLADDSFWQAVDLFKGPVLASHHNCRSLVPGDRQLTDDQIRHLIERDSVIGAALDDWMLYPGWIAGTTSNSVVTLERVVDHMDHICQLAGNARHIAIGSDLDGGFGTEQSPCDLDTIADLQKLPALLRKRGYAETDIRGVMHGNWLRFFQAAWQTN
ncbi:MAG TPA: membrane dipeptidase [Terriglobia bacterium]|nr:membrane dipeptidase [Terriglobia bacterium]